MKKKVDACVARLKAARRNGLSDLEARATDEARSLLKSSEDAVKRLYDKAYDEHHSSGSYRYLDQMDALKKSLEELRKLMDEGEASTESED